MIGDEDDEQRRALAQKDLRKHVTGRIGIVCALIFLLALLSMSLTWHLQGGLNRTRQMRQCVASGGEYVQNPALNWECHPITK